jgi:hypothetical protein
MRFFTPELYRQFNSTDDAEADRADAAWEEAIRAYRVHLDALRDRLPSLVQKLAELSLHDALILSRAEEIQVSSPFLFPEFPFPFPLAVWSAVAIVSVKHNGGIQSIFYCLWDHIRVRAAPEDWPFSGQGEHWLYDELDCVSDRRGPFLHRILLSTGEILEIPFTSVVLHRFALPAPEGGMASRHTVGPA